VRIQPDGRRVRALPGLDRRADYSGFRTYAYDDTRPEPPVQRATMPPGVTGDATRGRALFLDRGVARAPACHLVPGDDVWPAGSVGPDLSTLADRKLPDAYLYQQSLGPARGRSPNTVMPPWGVQGVFTPQELIDLVALSADAPWPGGAGEGSRAQPIHAQQARWLRRQPRRHQQPAVVRAEDAESAWARKGPAGKACADCHAGGPARSMRGVAVRYPRHVAAYKRVMSIETS